MVNHEIIRPKITLPLPFYRPGDASLVEPEVSLCEEPDFLLAADDAFFTKAQLLFCSPYPRATAAHCKNFGQVSKLVESLGVSLLILLPQNLLLFDDGESLLNLMRLLPQLRVHVYTGWDGVAEFFIGTPEASRIEVLALWEIPTNFTRG